MSYKELKYTVQAFGKELNEIDSLAISLIENLLHQEPPLMLACDNNKFMAYSWIFSGKSEDILTIKSELDDKCNELKLPEIKLHSIHES